MNERIKELAEQAKGFTETYDNELLAAPEVLYCFHKENFEKFAELIIQECADVGSKFSQAHPDDISFQIKKHFGI